MEGMRNRPFQKKILAQIAEDRLEFLVDYIKVEINEGVKWLTVRS
jgi:hypothetical protein